LGAHYFKVGGSSNHVFYFDIFSVPATIHELKSTKLHISHANINAFTKFGNVMCFYNIKIYFELFKSYIYYELFVVELLVVTRVHSIKIYYELFVITRVHNVY